MEAPTPKPLSEGLLWGESPTRTVLGPFLLPCSLYLGYYSKPQDALLKLNRNTGLSCNSPGWDFQGDHSTAAGRRICSTLSLRNPAGLPLHHETLGGSPVVDIPALRKGRAWRSAWEACGQEVAHHPALPLLPRQNLTPWPQLSGCSAPYPAIYLQDWGRSREYVLVNN